MLKQNTLAASFSLQGKGLHSGLNIQVTFNPAPENHGYKIKRVDLPDQPVIDAVAENVVNTQRGTVIGKNNVQISTIEHALAALYAMGVDNCLIELNGPEMPILDGSAKLFVKAIQQAGLQEQQAERKVFVVTEPIEYVSERGNRLLLLPSDHYEVEVMISFPSVLLREQRADLHDIRTYPREIASARTFCFVREIEPLLRMGLIKGGDLQNALVIYETQMSQEGLDYMTEKLGAPHIDASKLGYLSPLNYQNEPARHKLLDLIGDMSLLGCYIQGRLIATRPGHTFNTQCCRQLRNKMLARNN